MSENYDILSENNQSTVVSHYERGSVESIRGKVIIFI